MRFVLCVIQDQDVNRLLGVLMEHGYGATKLASTGGFLRQGNTTLFLGVEAEKVDEVVALISDTCHSRKQLVTPMTGIGQTIGAYMPNPVEVTVGGATVFVMDVERFAKV